ncbi:MAG: FAD-dependent oxidoreductase [Gemmatimonadota bacterium]|nr:FAD-dependent oxidoreductase [Gemmatimonadota bacterium]MDE3215668.1 FAD-dependent oxidoreductase [Gemmatimonadota bacterium]
MSQNATSPAGPDFARGVAARDVTETPLLGHANGEAVLLTRVAGEVCAVGATCTHYGAPLVDGHSADGAVRCPWHHACFSLRTGQALRPPALFDLPRYRVETAGDTVFVRERLQAPIPRRTPAARPRSVVIVGAGAAGNAAAETLRREGYDGPVTLVDPDPGAPCDRPNLSKDYLAGSAPAEWIPLHDAAFYEERAVEIRRARVRGLDAAAHRVALDDGATLDYGALILATGAEPIRLALPNAGTDVHVLRTLADSDGIVAAALGATRAVVLGASFIGLEVAASLRARGLAVHVVAPEARPLERVLGPALGDFIRALHEEHGVVFHLGRSARAFGVNAVELDDGASLAADFVVAGVGVRPAVALAEAAGLALDRGVVVDQGLRTSAPDVWAAGDLARWPDPHTGQAIRVEHWVVAERMGQTAARNVLGAGQRFDAVPFFWSQHYDVAINYVGHAERWDEIVVDGDPAARDCTVTYRAGGRELAVATIYRDTESLMYEAAMERRAGAAMPRG